ncbi:Hypothetical protein VCSRO94_3603 [Vibrio cholerae]|nr:Hypothetical protein VCSRO94_3603 [Vibrio cholerae]
MQADRKKACENKPKSKKPFHKTVLVQSTDHSPNALLRCEQLNADAAAYHLKHKTQRMVKMPRVANHT